MAARASAPASAAASNLPPWWGFGLALLGLAVLWFWLPSGQGWLGLVLVLGALVAANDFAVARGIPGPLNLPTSISVGGLGGK